MSNGRGAALRVLFVTTTLNVGGAEVMLVLLVRELVRQGVAVGVLSLAGEGAYAAELRAHGAEVFAPSRPLLAAASAPFVVGRFRPDVVHGWMYHGNVVGWFAARSVAPKLPLLWTVHQSLYDLGVERPRTRILLRLSRDISASVDHITYVSGTSLGQHRAFGYAAPSDSVISNGFDSPDELHVAQWRATHRAALGLHAGTFAVGQVARYHPMKNHLGMVRIAARLMARHPETVLLLVGEGLDTANSEVGEEIARTGIGDRVRLLGRRSDARELMCAMDALCVPSLWGEAFPMVMGEAMCCGVPCVTADLGDARELVRDVGHLVAAGDESAFADRLSDLAANDAPTRAALAQQARASIESRFGLASIVARYTAIYQRLSHGTRR